MNEIFTGIIDLDALLVEDYPDKMLFRICLSRKYGKTICNYEPLWEKRLQKRFPYLLSVKPEGMKFKTYYLYLIESISKLLEYFNVKYGGDINENALGNLLIETYNKERAILEIIAERGHLELLKYLLEKKGVNITNYYTQYDILKEAIQNKHLKILDYLIEKVGADIKNIALVIASEYGFLDTLKHLVEEKGANIHYDSDAPFRAAARNRKLEEAKYLVEKGANIHAYTEEGLRWAAERGDKKMVEYLIEKGADINTAGNEPLRYSALYGHLEIVKLLLENGANMDNEALDHAVRIGKIEIAKLLLENGADIHANNEKALLTAIEKGRLEVIKFLIQNGADIHANNEKALVTAIEKEHLEVVKFLVENGADIANNEKALVTAIEKNHLEIVKFLVENGADIHAVKDDLLNRAGGRIYNYIEPLIREGKKNGENK